MNGAGGSFTTSAQLRLTKKGSVPLLALTVLSSSWTTGKNAIGVEDSTGAGVGTGSGPRERETLISQEIPVKVLHEDAVQGLHEPRCRDPDVHIILPSLAQLKTVSDRFTRLATIDSKSTTSATTTSTTTNTANSGTTGANATAPSPKLELSANMHGSLKLAIGTDSLRIASVWTDLVNPALDPAQLSSQTDVEQLPSERMRAMPADDPTANRPGTTTAADGGEIGWAKVRIDARDWGRVLSVGRLSPRVVACKFQSRSVRDRRVNEVGFINETALVLYVYLPGSWNGEDSCLTVSVQPQLWLCLLSCLSLTCLVLYQLIRYMISLE